MLLSIVTVTLGQLHLRALSPLAVVDIPLPQHPLYNPVIILIAHLHPRTSRIPPPTQHKHHIKVSPPYS